MDAVNRRPQLPALSYLDIDQGKHDEEETFSSRTASAAQTHTNTSSASSAYQYPPPSYSHPPPHHANSWSGLKSDAQTPPDSRRTSGEEYDNNVKQTARQSLPSISEALGVEREPATYPPPPSVAQPSSQSVHPPPQSPTSASKKRPYMEPQHASASYGANSSFQYSAHRQDSAAPHSYPTPDAKQAYGHGLPSEPRQTLHVQTEQPSDRYTNSQNPSPQYEQHYSQSAGAMAPPSFPYGYTPYPPRYASQPSSPPSQNIGPIYQPSSQYAAPPTPSSGWRSENPSSRYESSERSTAPSSYGESVKRHLDLYDLEAALNEVAQSSGSVAEFSRRYGDRMHQSARPGPSLSNLPSVVEVEDMIAKSRLQVDALDKIREVILAQQAAFDQHIAEQRQNKAHAEGGPQVADRNQEEDGKGGFAGSDTKKRRGRAAPPGRCHSCNRAETPEWRRGPDGARTLCNACGLHYAKLTRKATAATKASVGNSNLRPKE